MRHLLGFVCVCAPGVVESEQKLCMVIVRVDWFDRVETPKGRNRFAWTLGRTAS